jgi:hypothetical protein
MQHRMHARQTFHGKQIGDKVEKQQTLKDKDVAVAEDALKGAAEAEDTSH